MASSPTNSVRIERKFDASPTEVWQMWTDAARVREWFGSDPAGTVSEARLDVRVGGGFEVTFANADSTAYTCSGTYSEVTSPSRLAFTWEWRNEPDVVTRISLRFEPDGEGTRQVFEHSGLGAATSHNYAVGWQTTFDKFARALALHRGAQASSADGVPAAS